MLLSQLAPSFRISTKFAALNNDFKLRLGPKDSSRDVLAYLSAQCCLSYGLESIRVLPLSKVNKGGKILCGCEHESPSPPNTQTHLTCFSILPLLLMHPLPVKRDTPPRTPERKPRVWRPPVVPRMIQSSFLPCSEDHCQTACRHLVLAKEVSLSQAKEQRRGSNIDGRQMKWE